MHMQEPLRAGPIMQIVDILCYDQQFARPFGIQLGQRPMGSVGLDLDKPRPPSVVKLVNQRRIAPERLGRRHILDPMPFPEPVGTAECGEAAFGADPRARQDDDVPNSAHRSILSHLDVKSAGNYIDTNVSDTLSSIMVSEAYHHPIGIRAEDIDHMGHVNNSVYLKWVQEAVIDFWEKVAPPEAVAKHLWIALSHEIRYRRPTFVDDLVVADVIAEKVEGAKAFFTTVIKRGEEVLAEVKSTWCCLDAVSRRPARLARDIAQRFLSD